MGRRWALLQKVDLANEGLSILENAALMGVPFPVKVKEAFEAMKKGADEGKGE